MPATEEYRELQENELLALQAIFEDDFREVQPEKTAWKAGAAPTSSVPPFALKLRPLDSTSAGADDKDQGALAEVLFRFPTRYPDEPPYMTLLTVRGVAESKVTEFLTQTAQDLLGSEMIFELAGSVSEFLAKHYQPEQSFYEQMLSRQNALTRKEQEQEALEEHKTLDVQRKLADQEKEQAKLLNDRIQEDLKAMERQRDTLRQQQKEQTQRWARAASVDEDMFQFEEEKELEHDFDTSDTGNDTATWKGSADSMTARSASLVGSGTSINSTSIISAAKPALVPNSPLRYRLLQRLHPGPMGCRVLMCLDQISDKPAMILDFPMVCRSSGRINRVKYTDRNQLGMGRRVKRLACIEKELEHLVAMDHENVVPYLGMTQSVQGDSITVQLASEYVGMTTLESVLQQVGRLDLNGVRQFTRQLTAGLAYLHQNHVVHGFVCPSNIFLTPDGHARIIQGEPLHRIHEFIATNDVAVESDDAHGQGPNTHANAANTHTHTQTGGGEAAATPRRYWPPPECMKGKKYDRRSDVWNLGCVVLELLLGGVDTKLSVQAALKTVKEGDLRDFLGRCLDQRVKDRYTSTNLLKHRFLRHKSDAYPTGGGSGGAGARLQATASIAIPDKNGPEKYALGAASVKSVKDRAVSPTQTPLVNPLSSQSDLNATATAASRYRTDFEEIEFIGKGGFADVVKVKNRLDGRIYAIKKIKLDGKDALFNNRIIREVTLLSQLHHEYIVRYYQAWIEDDLEEPSKKSRLKHSDSYSYSDHTGSSFGQTEAGTFTHTASTLPSKFNDSMSDYFSPRLSDDLRYVSKFGRKQVQSQTTEDDTDTDDGITFDDDDDGVSFGDGVMFEHESDQDVHTVHNPGGDYTNWLATTPNRDRNKLFKDLSSRQGSSSSSEETDSQYSTSGGSDDDDNLFLDVSHSRSRKSGRSKARTQQMAEMQREMVDKATVRPVRLCLYIQMEYCESTLSTLIAEGLPSQPQLIWRLFRQIVEGLANIHLKGMIHRDLKPSNIFLDGEGIIKIGDFGLATADEPRTVPPGVVGAGALNIPNGKIEVGLVRENSGSTMLQCPPNGTSTPNLANPKSTTTTGNDLTGGVGTALYVSPELEHARKGARYTQKVDIYSLGIIFFEMCHSMETAMERVKSIQALRLPTVEFPSNFDEKELEVEAALIRSMLDHAPKQRPSAADLLGHPSMPAKMEEAFMNEIQRALNNRNTSSYHTLMNGLFSLPVEPYKDFNYDAFTSTGFSRSDALTRMRTTSSAESILRRHGAVALPTPLLMPRLGESNAKGSSDTPSDMDGAHPSACVLMDRSGGLVTLPYDLTQSFCRFVARNKITKLKRYFLGQVFREDQNQPPGTQPRAINSLEYHIVDPNVDSLLPEAEVICTVTELLTETVPNICANLYLRINHFRLVEAVLIDCGVSVSEKTDTWIGSQTTVGLMGKKDAHHTAMIVRLILSQPVRHHTEVVRRLSAQAKLPTHAVERLLRLLDMNGTIAVVQSALLKALHNTRAKAIAKAAFAELNRLASHLENMQIGFTVTLDTSLVSPYNGARGCVFQFVRESVRKSELTGSNSGTNVSHAHDHPPTRTLDRVTSASALGGKLDIFAFGGQFDHCVKRFIHPSDPMPTSKVYGVSVAFDRLVATKNAESRRLRKMAGNSLGRPGTPQTHAQITSDTAVFVCSVGDREKVEGLKCHVVSTLWNAKIAAEMDLSYTRTVESIQDECREEGTVYLIVVKENGAIRIRNLYSRIEDDLTLTELVDYVRQGITIHNRNTLKGVGLLKGDEKEKRDHYGQEPRRSLTGPPSNAPVILDLVLLFRPLAKDKKRVINRASQRITPFFEEFSPKHVVSVAVMDAPQCVIKEFALTIDLKNEGTRSCLQEKYRPQRQQIASCWDFVVNLETKLPFIFLYSWPDDSYALMTVNCDT